MGATTADEPELPKWLQELEHAPRQDGGGGGDVPIPFMVVFGSISSVALGGGAVMGFRAFEDTAAYEALDKMEKPTPAAERQASRMAMRAFGWGTALAVGSAAAAVALAQCFGVRSAKDVATVAKERLAPFDHWLQRHGDGMVATGKGVGQAFDGAFDSAALWWRSSWLGSAFRGRVELVVAHHEQQEQQQQQPPPTDAR